MATLTTPTLNLEAVRAQFPILATKAHGKPLVYLDNAATSQKPKAVLDALSYYYTEENANIHRGVHFLAEKATADFEKTREAVRRFINAPSREEIIFTSGVTDSINLVANSFGDLLQAGDEILVPVSEHHSNIVPWQMLASRKGVVVKPMPITESGVLDLDAFDKLLGPKVKLVAVAHASNTLGTVHPLKAIIEKAHAVGARVLVDGAQGGAHRPIDVQAIDCDFYCLSAHKMYGPTGVGALYGKKELLEAMPPYRGGGEMIGSVSFNGTTWNDLPYKFEAGTPNIAGVVAYRAAIEFVEALGWDAIEAHEQEILAYATERLSAISGLQLIGTAPDKVGVISFVSDKHHPYDLGFLLDAKGIAIRTGHHCTEPLMDALCLEGTARASFAVYTAKAEIDALADALETLHN